MTNRTKQDRRAELDRIANYNNGSTMATVTVKKHPNMNHMELLGLHMDKTSIDLAGQSEWEKGYYTGIMSLVDMGLVEKAKPSPITVEEIGKSNGAMASDQMDGEYDNDPYAALAAYCVNTLDTLQEKGISVMRERAVAACILAFDEAEAKVNGHVIGAIHLRLSNDRMVACRAQLRADVQRTEQYAYQHRWEYVLSNLERAAGSVATFCLLGCYEDQDPFGWYDMASAMETLINRLKIIRSNHNAGKYTLGQTEDGVREAYYKVMEAFSD